jgi:hypothetical protein
MSEIIRKAYGDKEKAPILSVLICSLVKRKATLNSLLLKIQSQIKKLSERSDVEILVNKDEGEKSVGQKRNELVAEAKGKYICFVDDDDMVTDHYVDSILSAIVLKDPDVVSFQAFKTTSGKPEVKISYHLDVKHSNGKYKSGMYVRHLSHLCVFRKSLVEKFTFPEKNYAEDEDWLRVVMDAKVLNTESHIDDVLYYYQFDKSMSETYRYKSKANSVAANPPASPVSVFPSDPIEKKEPRTTLVHPVETPDAAESTEVIKIIPPNVPNKSKPKSVYGAVCIGGRIRRVK